jgi:hypothetical protein
VGFLLVSLFFVGLFPARALETTPTVGLNIRAGTGASEGQGIAVGGNGILYATGQFSGTGTFGTHSLTNGGGLDYWLAAYGSTGQVLWAQRAGTGGSDFGSDVIVDNSGDIVVAGVIQGTNDFHGVTNVAGFGAKDMFLARYGTNGALKWVRLAGSTTDDQAFDVAVDGLGNYFLGGRISGVATFGGTNIGSASQNRCVLAKYDSNGTVLWARVVAETDSSSTCGVTADAAGDAYITGLSTTGTGPFVAKYDANGTQQWLRVAVTGNTYFDEGSSVGLDASGNVYIGGRFGTATLTLGVITLTNANTTSSTPSGFVAKYDSNGNPQWATLAGARAFDVAVTDVGVIYLTGFSSSSATNVAGQSVTNQGGLDLFVAELNTGGDLAWLMTAGKGGTDLGRALVRTSVGKVYVIGEGGSELFDTLTFLGGVFLLELVESASGPKLVLAIAGSDLKLSWESSYTGYSVETAGAIGSNFFSSAVTLTVVPDSTNAYTTPLPATNLFFRLKK